MTTKHMPLTPEELIDGTASLAMIAMLVFTRGPQWKPTQGWKELYQAVVDNDRRWMTPGYETTPLGSDKVVRVLDISAYRHFTTISFDI